MFLHIIILQSKDEKNISYCDAAAYINNTNNCYNNNGPHWMTYEASYKGDASFNENNKKSRHPSVFMHLLRGEILIYNYLMIVLDAIYLIESDLLLYSKEEAIKSECFLLQFYNLNDKTYNK